jgi:hypothetical protein
MVPGRLARSYCEALMASKPVSMARQL